MQHNRLLKMETNHGKATGTYVIEPQDIVIDLFKAEEQINFVHDNEFLGWKNLATKGIRKHMVPGNHIDMFDKGNVEVFAKSLQHVLDNHNAESVQQAILWKYRYPVRGCKPQIYKLAVVALGVVALCSTFIHKVLESRLALFAVKWEVAFVHGTTEKTK